MELKQELEMPKLKKDALRLSPPTYIEFHHRIVEIVESCIHVDHVLSIDEMLCWLPFNWRTEEKIREIGQLIKYRIDAEFEGVINCTIGVASNGWLAKMASKMKKPNGFMILKSTQLPQVMYDLNLIDLHGIGSNMELRLHSMGIHTVEELYLSSQETLHAVWGSITGDLMWKKIRGEDIQDVDSVPKQRSLSHGHVIPPEFRNPNKAINVAHRLLQKAAFRARSNALNIGALDLQICYVNKQKWNQGLAFTTTSDSYFLSRAIKKLWNARPDHHLNISKINIVLHRLEPLKSYTPSLFDYAEVKNSEKLHQAIDQVIKKFGKQALYFGGAHGAMDTADPKIAFQHIPNLNNEK